MKFVHHRNIIVATIMIELTQNKVLDKNMKNRRINDNFATLQFCILAMPFMHVEDLATFVSI